jgi:hypothetical protein
VLREPDVELEALLGPLPLPAVCRARDRLVLRNLSALRIRRASLVTLGAALLWAPALVEPTAPWLTGTLVGLGVLAVAGGLLELRRAVALDPSGVRWRGRGRWHRLPWEDVVKVDVRRARRVAPVLVRLEHRAGRATVLRAVSGSWFAARAVEPRLLGAILGEEASVARARRALQGGTG